MNATDELVGSTVRMLDSWIDGLPVELRQQGVELILVVALFFVRSAKGDAYAAGFLRAELADLEVDSSRATGEYLH